MHLVEVQSMAASKGPQERKGSQDREDWALCTGSHSKEAVDDSRSMEVLEDSHSMEAEVAGWLQVEDKGAWQGRGCRVSSGV